MSSTYLLFFEVALKRNSSYTKKIKDTFTSNIVMYNKKYFYDKHIHYNLTAVIKIDF